MIFETTINVERNGCDCDLDVLVDYDAIPGCPGGREHPPEPPHIEINEIRVKETGQEIVLTSKQESCIEDQIAEHLEEQADPTFDFPEED